MRDHKVVGREQWMKDHTVFLRKEKDFTRQRDELARERRELPWVRVEKNYIFDSASGKQSLSDLFSGRSQLFLQHFMFGPGWKEGCPGCSFQADHLSGALAHLLQRDVNFVAVSRAPLQDIETFRKRMGWRFSWVSSGESDFNFDFNVSFTDQQKSEGKIFYNYQPDEYAGDELPGNSVFYKNEGGDIFHTYSSYARGCETLLGTYMLLDLLPKGRDEDGFKVHPMEWVRHHDKYGGPAPAHCH